MQKKQNPSLDFRVSTCFHMTPSLEVFGDHPRRFIRCLRRQVFQSSGIGAHQATSAWLPAMGNPGGCGNGNVSHSKRCRNLQKLWIFTCRRFGEWRVRPRAPWYIYIYVCRSCSNLGNQIKCRPICPIHHLGILKTMPKNHAHITESSL